MRGEIPYYYEHGVFIEDTKGVKLKYRIQKLIYRDQVNSSTIQRVYNLLITQPQIYRNSYELNSSLPTGLISEMLIMMCCQVS